MIHLRDMLCLSLVLLVASTEAFVHWAVQGRERGAGS